MSGFNINNFLSNLKKHNEFARTDKFDVTFVVPPAVTGSNSAYDLTLQCESSELPSRDLNVIEYRYYGFIKRVPHTNQYGVAAFTFFVTGDMWEKRLFDRWFDIMVPTQTGLVKYPLDSNNQSLYETNIIVNQYDTAGIPIYNATLFEAIPISMSNLNQNWSDDSPHRLTVTFGFTKWISDSTNIQSDYTDFGSATGATFGDPSSKDGVNNYTNTNNTPKTDNRT